MKKQKQTGNRKLDLNRQTLAPLQSDELSNVNGGAARTLTWTCDSAGSYGGANA